MFLRLSAAKLLDKSMAENAGNSISEVKLFSGKHATEPPKFTGVSYTPIFKYTLSLHVLGLGAVIHFFVSKPARFSVGNSKT